MSGHALIRIGISGVSSGSACFAAAEMRSIAGRFLSRSWIVFSGSPARPRPKSRTLMTSPEHMRGGVAHGLFGKLYVIQDTDLLRFGNGGAGRHALPFRNEHLERCGRRCR